MAYRVATVRILPAVDEEVGGIVEVLDVFEGIIYPRKSDAMAAARRAAGDTPKIVNDDPDAIWIVRRADADNWASLDPTAPITFWEVREV